MVASGDVLAKEGAEGLVCATVTAQGLGVAVKCLDGSWRRLAPAFVAVLRDLDAISAEAVERLDHHARLPVLGGDQSQGSVESVVRLRRGR
jgi:L-asparaginase II